MSILVIGNEREINMSDKKSAVLSVPGWLFLLGGIHSLECFSGELTSDFATINAFELDKPDQSDVTVGVNGHVGGIGTTVAVGSIAARIYSEPKAVVIGDRITSLFFAQLGE